MKVITYTKKTKNAEWKKDEFPFPQDSNPIEQFSFMRKYVRLLKLDGEIADYRVELLHDDGKVSLTAGREEDEA